MNLVALVLDGVRGAVILGVALAALPLAGRAPASIRRALLLVALVAAFMAPLATRALAASGAARTVALPFVIREILVDPAVEPSEPPPAVAGGMAPPTRDASNVRTWGQAPLVAWSTLLVFGWALGAAVVVARLGFGLGRARALVRRARRDEAGAFGAVTRAVVRQVGVSAEVAISDDIDAPAVAGIFRHVVLMPRTALAWSRERWRLVLLHELAHVARRDCLASAVAQLACAMHWFDPLAWLARNRLRRERERAADEDVLAAGISASDYAAHLLAIASSARVGEIPGALGMTAKPSELAERIEALVARDQPVAASPALLPAIIAAVSVTALLVACTGPRSSPQPAGREGLAASAPAPTAAASTPSLGKETRAMKGVAAGPAGSALVEEVAGELGMPSARIELTIDPVLQAIVDDELAQLVAAYRPAAATAVILDPAKGELLAIGDAKMARTAFVTGSTVKTVTVAIALESGAVRLEQKFDCRPRSIGARTISDSQERGLLDVAQIIEVSSNVGASRIFDAIGRQRFDEGLARFHLGEASTLELPDVARGEVPKTTALDAYDAALVAIGGGLSATPLQMAALYGVFANGGEYVVPRLVRKVRDGAGQDVSPRAAVRERVVRAETAHTVMQLLERTVQGGQGTGKRAKVQGVRVAGKTGTAGFTTPDGKDHVYASFIGVVPADAPRYVILVGAADPREGAAGPVVAAPAFAKIAARALGAH
jgi:beta-lactamase regulating signal transducer with metallopeptidase domain